MSSASIQLPRLVLASTSRYRKELLQRLHWPFEVDRPEVDEHPLAGETPVQTALRLSEAKARAVEGRHPGAVVVASDQVADAQGQAISKPGHHEGAVAQLKMLRGKDISFHTGLCVLYNDQVLAEVVTTQVRFRWLSDAQIERYLALEPAYDCAGSAKSEGLGIALLEHLRGDDPTALIGLPLIRLTAMLRQLGFDPLGNG